MNAKYSPCQQRTLMSAMLSLALLTSGAAYAQAADTPAPIEQKLEATQVATNPVEPVEVVQAQDTSLPASLQQASSAVAPTQPVAIAPPAELRVRGIRIGSATEQLFALQRSAQSPSSRNIDGEQASRSYQRYLKSFETAIPEHFETGMSLKK